MTRAQHLRRRLWRVAAVIAVVGIAATTVGFAVVRSDVDRLERQRVDRPATQALLGVQHLAASVDQILATANGVVASSDGDPKRFLTVLSPDVNAKSTLAGMALLTNTSSVPRVVARIGDTHLLADGRVAKVPSASSTLVASRSSARSFELGFAALAAHGRAVVYLEVRLATTSPGVPFALVSRTAGSKVLLGSVDRVSGLTRWGQPVAFAGHSLTLFVRAGASPGGLFGIPLPGLVLLVGCLLTAVALMVGVLVVRRDDAVEHLGVENRALDLALEQQRVIEGELRAWQERFRTILRGSPDTIVLYDMERDSCEVLNRVDLFGHPIEAIAEADGLRSLVARADHAEAAAFWARLRGLQPEQVCEATLRLQAANGETRYARLRFSPLELDADETPRLLGSIGDVTEQTTNELREAELEEALRRSQRLEAVGQLAGGVAHDFNNLLAAILASAELLSDYVPEGRPREYTTEIERAAMHGAALVRQLLTFAQRDHAEPRVVDINEVIAGMEPLLRRSLGEHVQLQITTPDTSVDVFADPTHLEQVVLNLAVNARDAMPSGGVLWIATAIEPDDDNPQNDRVLLSVTDTGTGIDPKIRSHMFEAFVSSKEPGEGTGLGLSTVQNIVQSMQGRIDVVSRPGEGTTFEISFARRYDDHAVASVPAEVRPSQFRAAGERVLLVEDETPVRAALADTLDKSGFVVTAVSCARDALHAVEQREFDVVVTDAVMPGMSGPELMERLQAVRPALPIVLMSGYMREIFDSPSDTSLRLRKPFTTRELLAVMEQALGRVPSARA